MWYCGFQGERPVELVFHLPNAAEGISSGSHGLSKIVVWNYNRGIKVGCRIYSVMELFQSLTKTKTLIIMKHRYFEDLVK